MPYLEPADLSPLDPPFEVLDLTDGQTIILRVLKFQQGTMDIRPRGSSAPKTVSALRVQMVPGLKTVLPDYWDITAKHLQAALLADLESRGPATAQYKVTKVGPALTGRHSLVIIPD